MLPKYFEFICPVKILSGRKALSNLPYELTQLGAKHPMLLTDKGIVAAGLIKPVEAAFADSDMKIAAMFDETPVDSSDLVVNQVAGIFKGKGCDALVAVGGGSVIDTAKGVNIVLSEKTDDLLKFQGVDRVSADMYPFVAVPTTAGTGSEVTAAAVIKNEGEGVKMAFMSNRLYPNVALLDPAMTMTVPPQITAATGMDALTHAIEAYTCLQKNPVSDAFAAAAIKLVSDYLLDATEHGDNEEARMALANAALLAGIAFSNSMVGMVHGLAHATGGVAHVPHGTANSIYLPYVLEYNAQKIPGPLAEVAQMLGASTDGLDAVSAAMKSAEAVRDLTTELNRLCGLPLTLKEAGVRQEQLEQIATVAVNDGAMTYNPEEADYEDALEVVKKAF